MRCKSRPYSQTTLSPDFFKSNVNIGHNHLPFSDFGARFIFFPLAGK